MDLKQAEEILSNISKHVIYNKYLGIMFQACLIEARDVILKELKKDEYEKI